MPTKTNLYKPTAIGQFIKANRDRLGYAGDYVSAKAGLSNAYVGLIEGGKRLPSPEVVNKIFDVLNLTEADKTEGLQILMKETYDHDILNYLMPVKYRVILKMEGVLSALEWYKQINNLQLASMAAHIILELFMRLEKISKKLLVQTIIDNTKSASLVQKISEKKAILYILDDFSGKEISELIRIVNMTSTGLGGTFSLAGVKISFSL